MNILHEFIVNGSYPVSGPQSLLISRVTCSVDKPPGHRFPANIRRPLYYFAAAVGDPSETVIILGTSVDEDVSDSSTNGCFDA